MRAIHIEPLPVNVYLPFIGRHQYGFQMTMAMADQRVWAQGGYGGLRARSSTHSCVEKQIQGLNLRYTIMFSILDSRSPSCATSLDGKAITPLTRHLWLIRKIS